MPPTAPAASTAASTLSAVSTPAPTVPPKPIADDPVVNQFADDPLMKTLLELRQKEGRDNAMVYYVAAGKILPTAPDKPTMDLMQAVLNNGCTAQSAPLLSLRSEYQAGFEEIRKGAAIDYARNVGWVLGLGPATPMPNYRAASMAAKMMCAEGRYLEERGQYAHALDNYLTVLTMGRDYTAPRPLLIGFLVGSAIQNISLKQVHRMATNGLLDRPAFERLLARLKAIENTEGSLVEAFRGESEMLGQQLKDFREHPAEARKSLQDLPGVSPDDVIQQLDRIEAEHKQIWDLIFKQLGTPYWQRDDAAFRRQCDRMLERFHPLLRNVVPPYAEIDARNLVVKTNLLEVQLATALAAYKLEKGKYPPQLAGLAPAFFQTLPQDPFVGSDFKYFATPDGSRYSLYSVGPDRTDNGGKVRYDPQNDAVSAGDVFY